MSRHLWTPPTEGAPPADVVEASAPRVPATVRADWTMPEPPPGGPWHPVVHDTGDGWSTSWEGEDGEEGDLIVGEAGWPFVEDFASASDWEAADWWVV